MASKRELVLIILVSSCFSMIAKSDAYDYFWLVQHWPPSVCSSNVTGSCQQDLEMFAIYGFWPENNQGKYPSYCSNSSFDPKTIESIRSQLDTYWPIVYEGSNEQAWKFAWEAHGTCSESRFNQTQYFEAVLKLRRNPTYDLRAILKYAEITPGGLTPFIKNRIKSVIFEKYGKLPGIRCNINKNTGRAQFSGIVLCFEHDGETLRHCPSSANQNCTSRLYWPTAETSQLGLVSDQ